MKRRMFIQTCAAGAATLAARPTVAFAQPSLEDAFKNPGLAAGAKTWWHWMNGNVTADGITRDLEAMKRVGVGGFQIFDVGTGIPQGPVVYLSEEWARLMQHAAKEAGRLGLEYDLHNCPGWSSTGGPWITPEMSMQRLVWTETQVEGGARVETKLKQPYVKLGYYRDAAVIAYPAPADEGKSLSDVLKSVTSSGGAVDATVLVDGDLGKQVEIRPGGGRAWILMELSEPITVRSAVFYGAATVPGAGEMELEVSDDGKTFRAVSDVRMGQARRRGGAEIPGLASFAAATGRYFRLSLDRPFAVSELELSGAERLADWTYKSNLAVRSGPSGNTPLPNQATGAIRRESTIDPHSVVDITRHMDAQGVLRWQAPAGKWTILRMGHTPTGITNNAAPSTGLGLECDKYNKDAYDFHFHKMFERILPALKALGERGLAGALIDSYEVGPQNWTKAFPDEFQLRRGYSLYTFLPAMTGRVVGSVEMSEHFLWDVRRTQADLIADNYYGHFAELCRKNGIKPYTEPYAGGPFDEIQIGSRVDVPMGEFWQGGGYERSVKLAASVAHINGRAVVGAESFTSRPANSAWQEYPYSLKAQGDWMYTLGLNQFIFHRYALQPHPDAVPGMTMGQWGFHFDRTNTWFEPGKAWLEYVARCQSLLRQGLFVADLAYFTGEDAPTVAPPRAELRPVPPVGYDYDTINAEAIVQRASVKNGRIVLPDGMSYAALVLNQHREITLEVLGKIRELVRAGMTLIGPKPAGSPSLADGMANKAELQRVIDELWGGLDGQQKTEKACGQGHVYWTDDVAAVMSKRGSKPDFAFTAKMADAPVNYIHRRADDVDYYFVANRRRSTEELVCEFRAGARQPELWDPATGEMTVAPVYDVADGVVKMPLRLEPAGSVFVVFRKPANEARVVSIVKDNAKLAGVEPYAVAKAGRYADVKQNFTISAWVRPDYNFTPPNPGVGGAAGYVFYAPAGEELYGVGHAACGLAVGRNGVFVFERTKGMAEQVLEHKVPVSGWTHVALVYKDGAPSVYLNGKLAAEGKASGKMLHPGVGESFQLDGASYFQGSMGEPVVTPGAADIAKSAATAKPLPEEPPVAEVAAGGLLVWRNGKYALTDAKKQNRVIAVQGIGPAVDVKGPWKVTFPAGRGAPAEITLKELGSLHVQSEDGVKYFSGTATYAKTLKIGARELAAGKRLFLDLGAVAVLARVKLNGKDLGILWKPPFRVDITEAAKAGDNALEVEVTNLWINRLIGDEQLPAENEYAGMGGLQGGSNTGGIVKLPEWYAKGQPKPAGGRVTFTTWRHYDKTSPLVESGLIGPVKLRPAVIKAL